MSPQEEEQEQEQGLQPVPPRPAGRTPPGTAGTAAVARSSVHTQNKNTISIHSHDILVILTITTLYHAMLQDTPHVNISRNI